MAARRGEPFADRCRAASLEVVDCAPHGGLDPIVAWRLRSILNRECIDLVHAHTAHGATLGALATLGSAVPLIIARRVDFPLRGGAAARWKYGRAATIIAVSHAVARVLERSGIAGDRVIVVPDGMDVHRRIVPADAEMLSRCGVPAGALLVVQVSQLVAHKDPINFVRAMKVAVERVPGVHALLAGDGPLRQAVEAEVKLLELGKQVHVLGYRDDADALLAAADVATLSSAEEGMGSVLLDAMMLGKPVAATMAGGIPEIVTQGETGFLAPRQVSGVLGVAIAKLLGDPSLRTAMGAAARRRALLFSVERMTDATVAVYGRAINGTMPPPA